MGELIEGEFQESTNSDSIVAYQYNDLQRAAKSILAKATQTANQKIEQAKKNIVELEEKMRQQGYDKGYAQGLEAGEKAGRETGHVAAKSEFTAQVDGVNGALQNMLGELNFRKQTIQAEAEADLLNLAIDIAKRIVRREVIVDERFVVPIIHEAIALTNNRNDLIVKLNPQDRDIVSDEIPALKAIFSDIGRIKLLDDETVSRGGVKVVSREGDVDMQLEEQFAALERALIGDIEGMREWDGQTRTALPVQEGNVEPGVVSPAHQEAVSSPAEPHVRPKKSQVEPEPRQKPESVSEEATATPQPVPVPSQQRSEDIPSQASSKPSIQSSQSQQQPASASQDASTESSEGSQPASVMQSSLAGITDLSAIPLDSAAEAAISEVLSSDDNVGG